MNPVVFYLFLALIQGEGLQGHMFPTMEQCRVGQQEVKTQTDLLAISECTELRLTNPKGATHAS